MNSSRSEQTAQAAQCILERLKSSGGKGLTKKVLAKKKLEEQALKEVVRAGKVANLGAANSSYYVLLSDQSVDSVVPSFPNWLSASHWTSASTLPDTKCLNKLSRRDRCAHLILP